MNHKNVATIISSTRQALCWSLASLYLFSVADAVLAQEGLAEGSAINLNFPDQNTPFSLIIDSSFSQAHGLAPGDVVETTLWSSEGRVRVLDSEGRSTWLLHLDQDRQAQAQIYLGESTRSGPLTVRANGIEVPGDWSVEKLHQYRFSDGTTLRVHFKDEILEKNGAETDLPSSVLDAAVMAYQTITQFEGFSTQGYAFASPDRAYAYDPDQTIDIYLGDPGGATQYAALGWKNKLFRDAPCFDTLRRGGNAYDAVILLPANYKEFIRNWEKINPSTLGKRNLHVDLRGTLIHEMLHSILFYYNKNLNKNSEGSFIDPVLPDTGRGKHLDWYVEGLARYFETFAGARHDFYSQGFKETLPDKIRFSRGGSNYFMRYPDQAFVELRYENALFWRFIDYRYGMSAIEDMSRIFRDETVDFAEALERVTGLRYPELLKAFSAAVLTGDFGLKEDSVYLSEIARTRLRVDEDQWFLLNGTGRSEALGKHCLTDWVGQWDDLSAEFGELSLAGDATGAADVSGWATDFVEITFGEHQSQAPSIRLRHGGEGKPLLAQVFIYTRGGSVLTYEVGEVTRGSERSIEIRKELNANGLTLEDVEKAVILITNSDPVLTAPYELIL